MALADPDLPPGIALPELRVDLRPGLDPDRYRWLSVAYYDLPRRSRVVVVLRLPLLGRRPLTLRSAGELFGLGPERVRQLAEHAVWVLLRGWLHGSPGDLTSVERHALLASILDAAIDRHPLDVGGSGEGGSG